MRKYFADQAFFSARLWSNDVVKALGPMFKGDGVNVSGWKDSDKDGAAYKSYFPNLTSYAVTNYPGVYGLSSKQDIPLDLTADLPTNLRRRFDLVFNHTTLEHVFDFQKAMHNLCEMSRDAVLIIVPFAQIEHATKDFGDFWRFSPGGVQGMFEKEGLHCVYLSSTPMRGSAVYVTGLGVRDKAKWASATFPKDPQVRAAWSLGAPSLLFKVLDRTGIARRLGLAPSEMDS